MEENTVKENELKDIEKLLAAMGKHQASDLHLKPGLKPIFRIGGVIHDVGVRPLTSQDTQRLITEIMTDVQQARFEKDGDLDFAYSMAEVGRFRINVFRDRGCVSVAVRRVNVTIPGFSDLNLPEGIRKVAEFSEGLVIVAGPTGSGKSTTLASILDHINQNQRLHIITIEDPIEYLFKHKKSLISQREIGIDVESFGAALKHVVRQDPDVILVGEMRDFESFEAGLMAAETGHLVFGTIHASSASQTILRLLDLFPTDRQKFVREGLAFNLRAVVCQRLIPSSKEGMRAVPAVEVMLVNPTISKLIQEGEDKKIQDVIRGGAEEGMQDFNQSLLKLIKGGLITRKVALEHSSNPDQLKMNLQGIFLGEDRKIIG